MTTRPSDGEREQVLLIDRFLEDAIEIDVDALCDGEMVKIGAVMQHVEEAGVHSGDSACVIPAMSIGPEAYETILGHTRTIALELGVIGLINVQYAVVGDEVYVIEANPRASRTVPFVSKATGVSLAKIACRLMLGERLADIELPEGGTDHVSVKEAVLPFQRFPGADAMLGPEMRSTGEVMGIADDFPTAFGKAQAAAGAALPDAGTVFITVHDRDKPAATQTAASLARPRLQDHRHGRHRTLDSSHGHSGRGDQQDRRRLQQRRRVDRARGRAAGREHALGKRRARRWLRDSDRRDCSRHPVHHDDDRRKRGCPRDWRDAHARRRSPLAPGAPRVAQSGRGDRLTAPARPAGTVRPSFGTRDRRGALLGLTWR